jgi:hypothetical protein
VVPVMYCYMDDLANWARRMMGLSNRSNPLSDQGASDALQ